MEQATSTKHGGEPNPLDSTGLCLLSLDGGGVRGLSTLYILKIIMDRLNHGRKETAKPCEVFDLMGGTSTGGVRRGFARGGGLDGHFHPPPLVHGWVGRKGRPVKEFRVTSTPRPVALTGH